MNINTYIRNKMKMILNSEMSVKIIKKSNLEVQMMNWQN